ncbi:neuron navigator 3-like [Entelurus aequoreus]|uniref:neuron navigator 3-like n=1 Tax=Entelurus aequoreus TaxID=161455 RepID=UPI002B1CE62F|nr:neuron navigator 3-like [Entelurus aequoreus]
MHIIMYSMHIIMYSMHSIMHSIMHIIMYSMHIIMYSMHKIMYSIMHSIMYSMHSIMYSIIIMHIIMYSMHIIMYSMHSIMYSMHSIMHSIMHIIMYSMHIIMYSMHKIMYSIMHSIMYSMHSIMYSIIMHSIMYSFMHSIMHSIMHIIMYSMHIIMYSMHSIMHSIMHIIMYSMHIIMYSIHSIMHSIMHIIMYSMHIIMYSMHNSMYSIMHSIMYSMHSIMYSSMHSIMHSSMHSIMHSIMYSMHSIMYSIMHSIMHIIMYSMHIIMYSMHSIMHIIMYSMHIIMYSMHNIMYSIMHSIMYSIHSIMYSIMYSSMHCIMYSMHSIMYSIMHSTMHIIMYSMHIIMYSMHSIMHSIMHIIMYSMHSIMHSIMRIIMYSMHSIMHSIMHIIMYSMHSIMHSIMHIIMYSMHIIMYSMHNIMYSIMYSSMYSIMHSIMYSIMHSIMHIIMYSMHIIMYSMHNIMYSIMHSIMYSMHSIMHSIMHIIMYRMHIIMYSIIWDDSSSVSSGLSDTLDNISTDDLNTPAYPSVSSPRKSRGAQSQRGSKSKHAEQEVSSSWAGAEDLKKVDVELDANMDPNGASSRWKSSSSSQAHSQYEEAGQKATALAQISQTGSLRRGMTAQVGITPPRTKGTSSHKTPGKTDDAKASEKGKVPSKSASGIQRSPSDAGKSSGDEGKKPPSGIGRPPTTGSFGYKKIPGASGTLVTSSGATLSSGSATLGKAPKSSAALGKSAGVGGVRKTSLDGSQPQDDGILLTCGGSKVPLQYRSLPRPAKSSNVSGKSVSGGTAAGAKRRDGGKVGSGDRSSPINMNQTDKEKVTVTEQDPGPSPTSSSTGQTGLRQPGSKYPDIASPTFRRLFGTKASSKASSPGTPDSGKCPSTLGSPHGALARQASLESPSSGTGSLGSASGPSGGSSPLYGKTPDPCGESVASSPASGLSLPSNARPWPACSSSAGSKDTLSCQSMSSLHTSSESIDLPLGHHGPKVTRTGSVKSTLSEGMPLDRNTLPKKRLRYPPSSRQASHEDGMEWLRSHSTGGLQDTGSPMSPPGTSCTTAGKYHYSNLLSPTNILHYNLPPGSSNMSRSNSIPAHDSFDLYGEGHPLGGSATSLEDRPRAISRSNSFRDSTDEVHGSSLSLVSSTSSLYSATEEKAHSEGQTVQNSTQIRKLRRELDASQEKVATLTSQLSANAHLVAAFEKSLSNMTCRLQSLTMTAEQKESELVELRETIDSLKTQNSDAQTAIQVALNGPDHQHKDLRIRRQHSSESMSSINSAASHSSMGSLGKDGEDKNKKKKKNWVADSIPAQLRSSFKHAFSKKKTKSQSAVDEMEEMADILQSSPKLQHDNRQGSIATLHTSPSATELCECTEAEAEIILQLKNELREKELKLTDIRLEALSSAHHLDQIREAMNRMQNEIETLKAENDRLKSSGNATPTATPVKTARPPSETSSTSSSSSRQSLGLSLNNLNITDTIMSDILLDDSYEGNLRKEGRSVRIVVHINSGPSRTMGTQMREYLIGSIGVSGKTKWDVLDGVIRRLFKEYVFRVDPVTSLGLSSDSIVCYRMGEVVRAHSSEVPELLPCGYLVGDNVIKIHLKGVKDNSVDSLVFDTLIPKPIIQRYLNLLMEHRRIILSGPSGTGKSFLAAKLAEFMVSQMGQEVTEHNVARFNVDQNSSKDLRQYLSNLAERCNSSGTDTKLPSVVILDNLHHVGSLSDIFNGFLNCKYHKCPYVIGTMNQGVSSSPNLELHHNFRWVLCTNHTEPVKGFLGRFLRRKLIETELAKNTRSNELIKTIDWIPKTWLHLNCFLEAHSSSDVTIGPRLFLSCPMDVEGSRVWFTDLWNYSLVPYLLEAVREGLQLYGKRAAWEDPSKWVSDTYPWKGASLQQEGQSLLQLRPEDVGYEGYSSSKEGASSKQVSQSDTEGDPLMNMLLRLQEAANYSSTQSCDSDSTGHHDDQLDSSLESAL